MKSHLVLYCGSVNSFGGNATLVIGVGEQRVSPVNHLHGSCNIRKVAWITPEKGFISVLLKTPSFWVQYFSECK